MLPLILALMSDPAVTATTPTPPTDPLAAAEARALQRTAPLSQAGCENPQLQRAGPVVAGTTPRPSLNDLMHRSGDAVRVDLLLERRINGCSAPLSFTINTLPVQRQDSAPAY
jgi:hypothetical protein